MEKFSVHIQEMKKNSEELLDYSGRIRGFKGELESIKGNIRWRIGSQQGIRTRLSKIALVMEEIDNRVESMGNTLNSACSLYSNTENRIIGNSEIVYKQENEGSDKNSYKIDSGVFDENNGRYGGDQNVLKNTPKDKSSEAWNDLVKRIHDTYPGMTDEQIDVLLKRLNNEGCGYVVMANSIFAVYEGREAEFEKDFGMKMYKNGKLNHDELLVDIYCKTDNHRKNWIGKDTVAKNEDWKLGEGWGKTKLGYNPLTDKTGAATKFDQRKYRLGLYLKEKGAKMNVTAKDNVNIVPEIESFREISEESHVVVNAFNVNLEDEDGSLATEKKLSGHAMSVTGVTEDGRYIVSSWGEKYYIDPKKIDPQKGGSLEFETYHYEEGGQQN